jgi:hypothetical protein
MPFIDDLIELGSLVHPDDWLRYLMNLSQRPRELHELAVEGRI